MRGQWKEARIKGKEKSVSAPMIWVELHAVVVLLELTSSLSRMQPPAVTMGLLTVQLEHGAVQFISR
jgi:hypothetical protein